MVLHYCFSCNSEIKKIQFSFIYIYCIFGILNLISLEKITKYCHIIIRYFNFAEIVSFLERVAKIFNINFLNSN